MTVPSIIIFIILCCISILLLYRLITLQKQYKNSTVSILTLKKKHHAEIDNKNKFLATASHDLQQPHQALGLFLAAVDIHELSDKNKNIIHKARDAHEATSNLLSHLLDISQLDAMPQNPNLETIALHDFVHNIGMNFMAMAEEQHVELRIRLQEAYVLTNTTMLERILTNILLNAFRHTNHANILLAIRKKREYNQDYWHIEVYDNGIGIPPEKQRLIFQEFTKLARPQHNTNGLGLGLAIAQRLSHILQHPIGLRSRLGHGSCFHIKLKACAVENKKNTAPDSKIQPVKKDLKVVVINQNKAILDGLETLLQSWGCQVKTFPSSLGAKQILPSLEWQADTLIIDGTLRCTHLDLNQVQDIYQTSRQSMPMILIVQNTENMFAKQAKDLGFSLLTDPVNSNELQQLLSAIKP